MEAKNRVGSVPLIFIPDTVVYGDANSALTG
jgi:hypothetical protein